MNNFADMISKIGLLGNPQEAGNVGGPLNPFGVPHQGYGQDPAAAARIQAQASYLGTLLGQQGGLWKQQLENQGALGVAGVNAMSAKDVAGIQAGGQRDVAGIQAGGQRDVAGIQSQGQQRIAGIQAGSAERIAGTQAGSAERIAGTQADASKYPYLLRQQRFDSVFPWMQQQYGTLGQQMGAPAAPGTAGPEITAGGVFSAPQIQQQVNALRAQNDARAQSQTYAAQKRLSGRGMQANSPLLEALGAQYQGQAMQANTEGERQARYEASGLNAKQRLASQTAREQQFASRQQEDIERRKILGQQQSALLGALGGLI